MRVHPPSRHRAHRHDHDSGTGEPPNHALGSDARNLDDRLSEVPAGKHPRGLLGVVVGGGQAAFWHSSVDVEQRQYSIEHSTADVLEIDIDTVRGPGVPVLKGPGSPNLARWDPPGLVGSDRQSDEVGLARDVIRDRRTRRSPQPNPAGASTAPKQNGPVR